MARVTLTGFSKLLMNLKKDISKRELDDMIAPALETFRGSLEPRIHNDGRASDGSLIGRPPVAKERTGVYEKYYGRKRRDGVRKKKKGGKGELVGGGYRIDKKDLEFTGELRSSVTFGTRNRNQAVYIEGSRNQIIAAAQEKQTKKDIYEPSRLELEEIEEIIIKELEFRILSNF